jgi:hypothetical protein
VYHSCSSYQQTQSYSWYTSIEGPAEYNGQKKDWYFYNFEWDSQYYYYENDMPGTKSLPACSASTTYKQYYIPIYMNDGEYY